jgi:hypothetical protein
MFNVCMLYRENFRQPWPLIEEIKLGNKLYSSLYKDANPYNICLVEISILMNTWIRCIEQNISVRYNQTEHYMKRQPTKCREKCRNYLDPCICGISRCLKQWIEHRIECNSKCTINNVP